MKPPNAVLDIALSTAAGYVGTKAMEPVSMKLYELEPKAARDREDAVRPGPPYRVAAEKLSRLAVAMSIVGDELMTPASGFSAPNLDYPMITHARGLVAHLFFGLAVAATVEAGWEVVGRRPDHTASQSSPRPEGEPRG